MLIVKNAILRLESYGNLYWYSFMFQKYPLTSKKMDIFIKPYCVIFV
ncbi:hypothetical protein BH09BAC1_BH09BAC1_24210 [soil metagenome]